MEEAVAELAVSQTYTTAVVASYLNEKDLCPHSAYLSSLYVTA